MLDELGRAPVLDLSDVSERGWKANGEARLLEHFAHEPFRDKLVVLDDTTGKGPERLLAVGSLKYEDDLISPPNDRRRDMMGGPRIRHR